MKPNHSLKRNNLIQGTLIFSWLNKFPSGAALDILSPAVHIAEIRGRAGGTRRGSLTNDGTV